MPETRYTSEREGSEIDDAFNRILNGEFFDEVDTIADAQEMTRAEQEKSRFVVVLGSEEPYDEGGGFYHFDPEGTEEEDGIRNLHPSDYDTAGPGHLRKLF
jgi:hypothetical protein